MRTPIGPKRGVLSIATVDGVASGTLYILGNINAFTKGSIRDNLCRFSGEIKTAIESVAYEAEGVFEHDRLTALAKTVKGDMPIIGTRRHV